MPKPRSIEFVGEPGPGAMIQLDLPQPGQHVGRRLLKIEDIPSEYFTDAAGAAGETWRDALGVERSQDGLFEIKVPERFTSEWFRRREAVTARRTRPGLRRAEAAISASAREALTATGSLRIWARGRGSSAARMHEPEPQPGDKPRGPGNPPPPPPPPPSLEEQEPAREQEAATDDFYQSIAIIEHGTLSLPTSTWGGGVGQTPIDLEAEPEPALFLVQVVGISAFLGNYGLGRTVKTFTLLPGESTTISTRTWRASEESISQSSSIIDSYDESASERFASTVLSETTDTATQSQTENWHAEAEAGASFGFGSASVSGGGSGEYSSGTEEFAKSVDEAVREHTSEASSHRENSVTSSSERTTSSEDEEVIERTIKNINVRRVLNFTFRELNQEYITKTHLKEVRVAFSNGNAGSWREEPLSGLRGLVSEFILPAHVDEVCQDILKTVAVVLDANSAPVRVLEQVQLDKCGTTPTVRDAAPNERCEYAAPKADGSLYYRWKRGPLGQPATEAHPVEGVLLKQRTVVMATDSVVVEALLGKADALDEYSHGLQLEAVREKQLANEREALAQRLIGAHDEQGAALFAKLFGTCPPEEETP